MGKRTQSNELRRELLVLLLAIAGGSVDAMMIVSFGVLTAAQTGNTILLGVALAQGRFTTGFYSGVSIAGFVIGAAIGELIIEAQSARDSATTLIERPLLAELVPLAGLLLMWWAGGPNLSFGMSAASVGLAAGAMGIQSAATLRLKARTTYITGTMMKFTTRAIRHLHPIHSEAPPTPGPRDSESTAAGFLSPDRPWIYGIRWLIYACAALAGGLLFSSIGAAAVCLPMAAVLAVIVLGRFV